MPLITTVAKPEEFNALTLAIETYEQRRSLNCYAIPVWDEATQSVRRDALAVAQMVLDALVAKGVLATAGGPSGRDDVLERFGTRAGRGNRQTTA